MKAFYTIFAILFALLAGWFIQRAVTLTGITQVVYYASAIVWAGCCFVALGNRDNDV